MGFKTNVIAERGCFHWEYNWADCEYALYHDDLGLILTVGEEHVDTMCEDFNLMKVDAFRLLFGEIMWEYFAEHHGVAERCMLKHVFRL